MKTKLKCIKCGRIEDVVKRFGTNVKFDNFDWDKYECSKCMKEKSGKGMIDLLLKNGIYK